MPAPRRSWSNPSVLKFLKKHGSDDPVVMVREIARDVVSRAFDLGWSGPPFSPFKLAAILDIDVVPRDAVFDARILPQEQDRFRIEYNPGERQSRVNFSISHEIGHTFFPDCAATIRNRETKKGAFTWELEFLCDVAAAELVLPYSFFAHEAKEAPPSIEAMLDLAKRYNASLQAVLLRYVELSERPCGLIMAEFDNSKKDVLMVSYSRPSSSIEISVDKGDVIPAESKVYECLNPGWSTSSTEGWASGGAVGYHVEAIGLPPLKHSVSSRVAVLISHATNMSEAMPNISYVLGDATRPRGSGHKVIAQVVNSGAALGAGFGRAMSKAWPQSAGAVRQWKSSARDFVLGSSQLIDLDKETYVFQMLAQKGVSSGEKSISLKYSSLKKCLTELGQEASRLQATVHMPRIGAGQAGGDWSIIEGMIYEEIVSRGIAVTVYDLPGSRPPSRLGSGLPLFESA